MEEKNEKLNKRKFSKTFQIKFEKNKTSKKEN